MPTTHIPYTDLPHAVRAAIEQQTGPVLACESSTEGFNSAVAARLHTETMVYFVKVMPSDHRWGWTQRREADLAPHVRAVAPDLIARIVVEGWDVLIFEALDGSHADYRPGSPDLPKMVALLGRIAELTCPTLELKDASQRLARYAPPDDLHYFAGDALLHTDWNNANVLVGNHARIVDWGWATRGAPWLDAAYWTIWLIATGHEPASAESWTAQVPVWRFAPKRGITAFADANAALWADIGGAEPDPWTARMVDASHRWAGFRHA